MRTFNLQVVGLLSVMAACAPQDDEPRLGVSSAAAAVTPTIPGTVVSYAYGQASPTSAAQGIPDTNAQAAINRVAANAFQAQATADLANTRAMVPGPQGPSGPQGPEGPRGAQGETGATGAAGAVGPIGPAGPTGPQGTEGAIGPAGATGPEGPAGPEGDPGPVDYLVRPFSNSFPQMQRMPRVHSETISEPGTYLVRARVRAVSYSAGNQYGHCNLIVWPDETNLFDSPPWDSAYFWVPPMSMTSNEMESILIKTTPSNGNKAKFQVQCQTDPFEDPADISIDTSLTVMRVNKVSQF